jgi:hypothetical protein
MADRSDDQLLTASDATRELARLGVDLSAASASPTTSRPASRISVFRCATAR